MQGVFFRDTCRREATARGVTGWVRNLGDGRVEAAFEGRAEAVEAMIAWCRRGPRGASVEHVDAFDEAPEGLTGFAITR